MNGYNYAFMEHLSQKQFMQISKHISSTNNLSLQQIENSIDLSKKQIEKIQSDLDILERAEHVGIQIRILNNIKTKDNTDLTEGENEITKKYDILGLQLQNELFCQQLQEKITELRTKMEDLMKIRAVFVENYPEANTSPRLSRSELEISPRRHLNTSGELNTSPKYIINASPKRMTLPQTVKERVSASDLMASPRRLKSTK